MRAEPPRITELVEDSPAAGAGLSTGDLILAIDGETPIDVIQYQLLIDGADPVLSVERGGVERQITLVKAEGEPAGIRLAASLFDRVKTCDNKCEFCFIYQLPENMRESLYLKDDDYRLSFLYGNFTTLTRFKETDFERVVSERISPLYVSIHATDPDLRARMLSNKKGARSLDWLRPLLDAGIEIHGQVVVCPGVNDGDALESTLGDVGEEWPEMASVGLVPLGVSRYNTAESMRPATQSEMAATLGQVHRWQERYLESLGKRLVFASDEFYLGAGMQFPLADEYEGFMQHENGIGMAAALAADLDLDRRGEWRGFESAPALGYRAERPGSAQQVVRSEPTTIITGELGFKVLSALIADELLEQGAELLAVRNEFFGGNIAVTGLLAGCDVERAIMRAPSGRRFVLPDVVAPEGRFIDEMTLDQLKTSTGRPIDLVPTNASGLRMALDARATPPAASCCR